jgi:hypothetical protein
MIWADNESNLDEETLSNRSSTYYPALSIVEWMLAQIRIHYIQ